MQKLKAIIFLLLVCVYISGYAQSEYVLDPSHTLIQFNVERFMVGEVTGVFTQFDGNVKLNLARELESSNVIIKVESLDSNYETRDGHLKGPTWLDAGQFKEIEFVSQKVYQVANQWYIDGFLTIKGVKKMVSFPFDIKGPFKDPTGALTMGLAGDLKINRQDYGITFSKLMDNGELFIGNDVIIKIRALAIAKK